MKLKGTRYPEHLQTETQAAFTVELAAAGEVYYFAPSATAINTRDVLESVGVDVLADLPPQEQRENFLWEYDMSLFMYGRHDYQQTGITVEEGEDTSVLEKVVPLLRSFLFEHLKRQVEEVDKIIQYQTERKALLVALTESSITNMAQ